MADPYPWTSDSKGLDALSRVHFLPGSSMYSPAGSVAHAVVISTWARTRMACGQTFDSGRLTHNLGRLEPCESCARALARSPE